MAPETSPFHTGILLIAHAPLASALKSCALHVFSECEPLIQAYDVTPETSLEQGLTHGLKLARRLHTNQILVLTDIVGATPFNIGKRLMDTLAHTQGFSKAIRLVCGTNVPMLMRALTYRHEQLEKLTDLVVTGGARGIIHVSPQLP